MNRRFYVLALFISLSFLMFVHESWAASYEAGTRAKKIWFDTLNRSAHAAQLKYKTVGNSSMSVIMAMNSAKIAVDMNSSDGHTTIIHDIKQLKSTMIMHDEKMYMLIKTDPRQIPRFAEDKVEKPKMAITSGTEKVNGKNYDFDKITFDNEESQFYYFEPGTDIWKLWRADGELLEILEYGTKPNDALFEVPAGYSKIQM